MVLAEHNNRLLPVAEKKRLLWRRGQRKFAPQAKIFFGYRKSQECSPEIFDFCANGIPVQERVDFFDTHRRTLFLRPSLKTYLKNNGSFSRKIISLRSAASPSAKKAQAATSFPPASATNSRVALSDSPVLITSSTIRTRLSLSI